MYFPRDEKIVFIWFRFAKETLTGCWESQATQDDYCAVIALPCKFSRGSRALSIDYLPCSIYQ